MPADNIPDTAPRRHATLMLVVQLSGVYLIGSLTLPVALAVGTAALFGGLNFIVGALLALILGTFTVLYIVGTITTGATRTTSRPGTRLVWALSVALLGGFGLAVGAWVTAQFDVTYGSVAPWMLLAGVPYVLAAALFATWWIRGPALAVSLAMVVGAGYAVPEHRSAQEWALRLEYLGAPRELVYVTEVPGYRRSTGLAGTTSLYEPIDGATVKYWGEQNISLSTSREPLLPADCGPAPMFVPQPPPGAPVTAATPAPATCLKEDDGLWYRTAPGVHEYVRVDGQIVVRTGAGTVVEKTLLRRAVLAARPVTDGELDVELPPALRR